MMKFVAHENMTHAKLLIMLFVTNITAEKLSAHQ
jgi:hypothetical protein